MNNYDYNEFLFDSGDDYPTYEDFACGKYKAEVVHRATGKVGTTLRSDMKSCVEWANKIRSDKFDVVVTKIS